MDKNGNFIVDGTATGINVTNFPYDLQQPTKKINNPDAFKILEPLNIKEDLVTNSNAKIAIQKRTHRVTKQKKKKLHQKKIKPKETSQLLTEESSDAGSVSKPQRKTELSKRRRTGRLSMNEKKFACAKKYERSCSIRKHKKSAKSRNLKPSKLFVESQNDHTKHKKFFCLGTGFLHQGLSGLRVIFTSNKL